MWPFKKNQAGSPREPKPDDWILAQGQRDGFPMIVRMANAYTGLAPLPAYDHHVIISVHLRNPGPNGFPSSEESDELESIEEGLRLLLEVGNDALCALVVTNNGLRDFIYYTRDVDGVRQKLEFNTSIFRGFVTEFAIEPARDWEIYRTFAGWLKRAN